MRRDIDWDILLDLVLLALYINEGPESGSGSSLLEISNHLRCQETHSPFNESFSWHPFRKNSRHNNKGCVQSEQTLSTHFLY